jgi:hypothetical protein
MSRFDETQCERRDFGRLGNHELLSTERDRNEIEICQDQKENSAHVLLKRNKNQSGARTTIQILTTGRAKRIRALSHNRHFSP